MNKEINKLIVKLMDKCADEEIAISLCVIDEDEHVTLVQGGDTDLVLECVSEQCDKAVKSIFNEDEEDDDEVSEEQDFLDFLVSLVKENEE